MYTLPLVTKRNLATLDLLNLESTLLDHAQNSLQDIIVPKLNRVINWEENSVRQPNLIHQYPFNPIKETLKSKSSFYQNNNLLQPEKPRPHVNGIQWLLALWQERNQNAPDYTSKTLTSGILVNLKEGKISVCYHTIHRFSWTPIDNNPVELTPLNVQNFKLVLNFQLDQAYQDWLIVKNNPQYRKF